MIPLLLAFLLVAAPVAATDYGVAPAGGPPRGAQSVREHPAGVDGDGTPAERASPSGDAPPPTDPSPLVDRAPLESLWLRGERAMAEGKPDEAMELFQEALVIDPDNGRTWNYLGGALFARGEFTLALNRFLRAAELSPRDPKVRNNLASVYDRLGRHAEAIEHYLAAIELDAAYAVPYRNLGAIYAYRVRDPALARKYWTEFLRLDPSSPDAPGIRQELSRLPE